MKIIKFTQEEINQLFDALETLPDEIYSECPGTPCDEDKALLSGIEKLKKEIEQLEASQRLTKSIEKEWADQGLVWSYEKSKLIKKD